MITGNKSTSFYSASDQVIVPELSKLVAIVVIIYKKPSNLERYSLVVLEALYSGRYDIVLLQPCGLGYKRDGCITVEMDDVFFASSKAHAMLMIAPEFYARFSEYRFLLEHQLDCLLLADRLDYFCGLDRDYISAAWIPTGSGWPKAPFVGLGGLSLRKVSSFERVSSLVRQAENHRHMMDEVIGRYFAEDVFWGRDAPELDPAFEVCSLDESLRFSFNGSPGPYLPYVSVMPPFGWHAFGLSTRDFLFYNRFVRLPVAKKLVWSCLVIMILAVRDFNKRISRVALDRKK
ncbi:MAG: DUF5672 family protein [Cyanobacteriota bacterium]|nr:DUF5672 family protein [Cyanobacteriota bacterium]